MKIRIALVLSLVSGASAGFATNGFSLAEAAGSQQCYYTVGVDRPTDCTTCTGSCSNGACCGIIRTAPSAE
jgi:hypothetical protein